MWYPSQNHHYRFFRNLPSLFRDYISFASLLLVCGLRHSRQSINQSNAKRKPNTTSLYYFLFIPALDHPALICLYLEFSLASSDISFFLPLFGLGFTRLNRKTRSLSCLMSAIGYCIVWFIFYFLFCCCCCSMILNQKGYTISRDGVDFFQMISLNRYISILPLLTGPFLFKGLGSPCTRCW